MGNVQISIAITIAAICVIVVLFVIFFTFFHSVNFLSWVQAWIFSNKEEMIGLTKLKGHYNANGYLVHSDSDIQLNCGTGSFKRFDSVDRDFRITVASTSFMGDGCGTNYEGETSIPPQPLRPAPVPAMTSSQSTENSVMTRKNNEETTRTIETTSISPIPRPVSAVNVANLISQSSFPVCITPPPSPCSPGMAPSQQVPLAQCEEADVISGVLKRAMSCDSICSDTSVALGDLEMFNVTGYLCIGLEYDSECWDLVVNVLEAKDLCGVARRDDFLDSYVRVSLLPDKEATIQTKVYRSTGSPSYKERFLFSLNPREQSQRLLCFHVYATDFLSHTLIGEGEIRLSDISLRQPVTTWVTLTDTGQKGTEFGELMFSISYLPTAERLTVVVVKARNLKFRSDSPGEAFVKVYLMQHDKKINKKKTSTKKGERSPIFNEAMMFSVPAHTLSTIQLRLTVAESSTEDNNVSGYPIGHVIVGAQASGRSLSHWNQMLTALRRPVAMWHTLRK
ncbi:synaptotagmin-12 [Anoplophora glabripennis]|uniref:synaptotagmin-12 n=1 Tax=Anoplophora glabripennis TaxID=217634 RepID=UPI0008744B05|nr:synaptotagmin-12 [Anoplophora glabripennis]